jgi:anti-anti-sigma factor
VKRTIDREVRVILQIQRGAKVARLTHAEYGSLDAGKLNHLNRQLVDFVARSPYLPLLMDLSQVQFFGASFIGVLFDVWNELRTQDRRLALCGLTSNCANLIRKLRLDVLFDIYPTQIVPLEKIGRQTPARDEAARLSHIRIQVSDVCWDPTMVRLEYWGEDGVPIRSVIVRRTQANQVARI